MSADKKKPISFYKLKGAKWKQVPTDDASETYDVMEATNDDVALEDLYGDRPEFFKIHEGDLHLSGPQSINGCGRDGPPTVFIIEGDLTVDGPLTIISYDDYSMLWIRGSLTTRDLEVAVDAQLVVDGSLHVEGALVTDLGDAGHLMVHGSVAAGAWVKLGDRGCIEFAKKPKARIIGDGGDALEDALRPDLFAGGDRFNEIREALLSGKPILR
jgi:hypothetical protein